MTNTTRIPVTILTGFLGSGKTTTGRNLPKQDILDALDSCLSTK